MKFPAFATLFCSIATVVAQTPNATEQAATLQASELLPAEALRGASFRVRDMVETDGYMAHFKIDSDFGTFAAVGVPHLKQRIIEIEAIRTLVETSKSDLFADGLKRSIEKPIDAVKNIVTKPIDSLKQAPKTVGHFFGKVGSAIGRSAEKVKESVSNDSPAPTAGQVGSGIGNTAKNVVGFDKAKLDTARQLKVDPYSDNARLHEEMDKVTWAFFAGGLPLRVGAAVASAGLTLAATNMVGVPEETYALTQSELAFRDARSLTVMGITEADVTKFQLQKSLSTTRRHRIVTALEALPTTHGRGKIILLVNDCETTEQADFLIGSLTMLAQQQRSGKANYAAIEVIGRLPGAVTASGELHVAAPVDHVTWTEQVAGFAMRDDLGTRPRVLVHTGKLSPAASAGFKAAGWSFEAVAY